MLPKSVSPRFVGFALLLVMSLLLIPLVPLELVLIQRLGLDRSAGFVCIPICMVASGFLVPRILSFLGIQVRSRSVEHLQAAENDREGVVSVELPIRIDQGRWLMRVAPVALFLGGLACLVLTLCLAITWFPPPLSGWIHCP